jgi:hypothetical protein
VIVDGGLAAAASGNGRHGEAAGAQLPPRRESKTRRDGVAALEECLRLMDVEPEAAKAIWPSRRRSLPLLAEDEEGEGRVGGARRRWKKWQRQWKPPGLFIVGR